MREKDGPVLSDLVFRHVLRSGIVGERSFDLGGFSVLHPDESSRDHESGAVGVVEVTGAVVRAENPRRRLLGRGSRGQRERNVGEATGFTGGRFGSHLGSKAMERTAVALDVGVDEAASEQHERFCFLTCEQEVTERALDVARFDGIRAGASVEVLLAVRIVCVESVPDQVCEQVVVPVCVSGQLDEEEVPVVDASEQRAGVAVVGYGRAQLRVKHVEDRSREQEVENFRGLTFEHFGSEEVGDGAWRVRELGQEEFGDRFVAKGDGSHLDTGGPTLSAVREELDLDLVQLDSELEHDGGDFGLCESEFGVAHLDQLTMRTESVQRELGLGSAADDHATAGGEAFDERGQAGCSRRRRTGGRRSRSRQVHRAPRGRSRSRSRRLRGRVRPRRASRSRRASGRATGERTRRRARTKR